MASHLVSLPIIYCRAAGKGPASRGPEVAKARLVEVSYPGPGLQHAMTRIRVFQKRKSVTKLRIGFSSGRFQSCMLVFGPEAFCSRYLLRMFGLCQDRAVNASRREARPCMQILQGLSTPRCDDFLISFQDGGTELRRNLSKSHQLQEYYREKEEDWFEDP